jgi:leucyl/phenylalanyl-tRNA--protein transferase
MLCPVAVFRLDERLLFPNPELADDSGLLAVGGDLSAERLLLAYAHGIFPWYQQGLPILWHSPDPRMVLRVGDLHIGRSLAKTIRRQPYDIRFDTAFAEVVEACADTPRPDQDGTWITEEMKAAYRELHRLGFAHSAEAWLGDRLVGGLYGVSLGAGFFGESMFAFEPDASKIAFVMLIQQLERWGITLIDCQVHTDHLARFGADLVPREKFLEMLEEALGHRTRRGQWSIEQP